MMIVKMYIALVTPTLTLLDNRSLSGRAAPRSFPAGGVV